MREAKMRSYVHGANSVALLGQTIGENLRQTVEGKPDSDALIVCSQKKRFTWRTLHEAVKVAGRALMARGVQKGDRVGLWSPNRHEWVVLQYATANIGAILVNLNPAYKTAELEYALQQSGTSLLIYARAFRSSDFHGMVQEVRGKCPHLKEVIALEDGWEPLLADAGKVSEEELTKRERSLDPDDPINIQYTSGTTGYPKGATLSHNNILNNGYFIGKTLGYSYGDRVCIPVPFYHCFGMVLGNLACTSHGACMVIPGEAFDPLAVLEAVQAEKCTALYGVPTMFIAVLDHPRLQDFDVSKLRTGIMAGSPCPVEVMKKVQTVLHMPEVTICYGMTETSPVSAQTALDDPLDKRTGTVGRVHPHVEVKVIDPESGQIVGRGVTGELCTRGYSVMLGYWNNAAGTQAAIDAARWMHTGDLATLDADGYLNIVGRIKDMIIRGGENVYPREVEEYLYTHPAVSDAQVIGVPSEKYGEEVMAWVKLKPGAQADEASLIAHCKNRISTYKIPRYWRFVDSFPMTVTGKIQKFKMREQSIEDLGLQKAAQVKTA
jgi:fatty-acyl-CoA synthase